MMKAFQPTHSTSHTAYCREESRSGHAVPNHPLPAPSLLRPAPWVLPDPQGCGFGYGKAPGAQPSPGVTMLHPSAGSSTRGGTYHHEVFGSVLDGPKNTQNNGHDV